MEFELKSKTPFENFPNWKRFSRVEIKVDVPKKIQKKDLNSFLTSDLISVQKILS